MAVDAALAVDTAVAVDTVDSGVGVSVQHVWTVAVFRLLKMGMGICDTHRTNIRHVTPFVDTRWMVIGKVGNCVTHRANIRYVTLFVDTR